MWRQTRQSAHISERIGAAGHAHDMGAYLAQYLGATNSQRPPTSVTAPTEAPPEAQHPTHSSSSNQDLLEYALPSRTMLACLWDARQFLAWLLRRGGCGSPAWPHLTLSDHLAMAIWLRVCCEGAQARGHRNVRFRLHRLRTWTNTGRLWDLCSNASGSAHADLNLHGEQR